MNDKCNATAHYDCHLPALTQALRPDQSPIAVVSGQALLLVHRASHLLTVHGAADLSIQVPAMVAAAVPPVGPVLGGDVPAGVHSTP